MPSRTSSSKPKAKSGPRSWQFEAIGTQWTIDLYENISNDVFKSTLIAIDRRVSMFDAVYSRFQPQSLVSRMSKEAGSYQLPTDAKPLMDIYQQLYQLTDGAMTPLIGNLLSDAGYDADYSLKPKQLRPVPSWDKALAYDFPQLQVKQSVMLDFGAAGKGYLIDLVVTIIEDAGLTSYCVNAGGDIRQQGVSTEDDRIGLEHPTSPGHVLGIASIGDRSLCGSAGNRRSWGDPDKDGRPAFHHIMSPISRQSVNHIAALWTVADTALIADALATALFFAPAEHLLQSFEFEYTILYDTTYGVQLAHSPTFPAEFFNAKNT